MGDLDAEFALFESEVAALEAEVCAFVFVKIFSNLSFVLPRLSLPRAQSHRMNAAVNSNGSRMDGRLRPSRQQARTGQRKPLPPSQREVRG